MNVWNIVFISFQAFTYVRMSNQLRNCEKERERNEEESVCVCVGNELSIRYIR